VILLTLGVAWGGTMWVHVLDVGQGDSVLIETPAGNTILIDAGPAGAQVSGQLEKLGVEELDLVVATHPHADHIGGMRPVVVKYPVGLYLDSGMKHTTRSYQALDGALDQYEVAHRAARQGETLHFDDDIVVTVLWPSTIRLRDTRSDLNSNSVVLRVDHGEDCFLFTGDAEQPTERGLLNAGLESCEVLKVAHHGSNHSTTASFIRAVDPDIALVSSGSNSYGHPGEEVLERLESEGAVIYRTDDSGHLALASSGQGIEVVDGIPWSARGSGSPNLPRQGEPSVTVAHAGTGEVPDLSGVRGRPPTLDEPKPRKACLFRRP